MLWLKFMRNLCVYPIHGTSADVQSVHSRRILLIIY